MSLHQLNRVVIGVPCVNQTAAYYSDFGLTPLDSAAGESRRRFATRDGGEQLNLVPAPRRRVVELAVGADDIDDIERIAASLTRLEIPFKKKLTTVRTYDLGTDVTVVVEIADRLVQSELAQAPHNRPGAILRANTRADGVLRQERVMPRKLGHVVLGSTDQEASQRLFSAGLGFKVSDQVVGRAAFLRCSTDHHNVLLQRAPVAFLHHTSWQVEDVDEVGRGATAMLDADPERHVWGLGRHHIGSNFFWYLRDPAGNFSEYYADLDCIVDDALWTPRTWEGKLGLYNWGPPPPPSFLKPDDLAALIAGAHAP